MLLLALAAPAAVGVVVLRAVWPRDVPGPVALRAGLAGCLGLGFASCGYFLAYALAGRPGNGFVGAELFALGLAAFVVYRAVPAAPPVRPGLPAGRVGRWLWVPFAAAAAVVPFVEYAHYSFEPHGDRDAVGIWNVRARFLARTADGWGGTFSPGVWHADYPLLLPGEIARCWAYTGAESPLVPAAISWVMGGLAAAVLAGGLNALRGGGQGWLAGFVLLSATPFVGGLGLQFADTPLATYVLATAVVLVLHDATGRRSVALPALAGALTGLAAWTKNEGQLFLAAVVFVRAVRAFRAGPGAGFAAEARGFVAGLALPVLVLAAFKTQLAPPNDLVAAQGGSVVDKLTDPDRHLAIVRAVGNALQVTGVWADMGLFEWGPGLVLGLPVYAALLGRAPRAARVRGAATPWALLGLMAAGYYVVYLLTPHDLEWHLESSLPRLLLQLWPLTLFAVFLTVATPDERSRPAVGPAPAGPAPGKA